MRFFAFTNSCNGEFAPAVGGDDDSLEAPPDGAPDGCVDMVVGAPSPSPKAEDVDLSIEADIPFGSSMLCVS
jgi:hypothetical protein